MDYRLPLVIFDELQIFLWLCSDVVIEWIMDSWKNWKILMRARSLSLFLCQEQTLTGSDFIGMFGSVAYLSFEVVYVFSTLLASTYIRIVQYGWRQKKESKTDSNWKLYDNSLMGQFSFESLDAAAQIPACDVPNEDSMGYALWSLCCAG